jgi:hypothetical protein
MSLIFQKVVDCHHGAADIVSIVTIHNTEKIAAGCHGRKRKVSRSWQTTKASIIHRFKTVKQFAAMLGCHPNSLRYACDGRCPRILVKMEQFL